MTSKEIKAELLETIRRGDVDKVDFIYDLIVSGSVEIMQEKLEKEKADLAKLEAELNMLKTTKDEPNATSGNVSPTDDIDVAMSAPKMRAVFHFANQLVSLHDNVNEFKESNA